MKGVRVDLVGRRFSQLEVISENGRNRQGGVMWECRCDCGRSILASTGALNVGHVKTCGCSKGVPAFVHGMTKTATYSTWASMKRRCLNPRVNEYPRYGGRGITVCDRWIGSFSSFLEDMGERPLGMSLDRINNELGYFKENCRWATHMEQSINRRTTKLEPHEPEQIRWLRSLGYCNREVAKFFGISMSNVMKILSRKIWSEQS